MSQINLEKKKIIRCDLNWDTRSWKVWLYAYRCYGKQRCIIFTFHDFYNIVVQIRHKLYT